MKKLLAAGALAASMSMSVWGYTVRQPGEVLRPTFHAEDTAAGKWTLNFADALEKAKAAGKYTILLNTGSWWCPFCETLEDTVFVSNAWKDYVAENGFYLAMLDFPYRGHVKDAEIEKSWHPELGDGWGFKCWLMFDEYLAEQGLTEKEGLAAIMSLYEIQKELALPSASPVTIKRWDTQEEFTYGKLGYPTLIVFDPEGAELGRTSFPWYRTSDVTPSEAQEYVIQALERIITGECSVCEDPASGSPDLSVAQVYSGWLKDAEGGIAGLIEIKTGKYAADKTIKVSGSVTIAGKKVKFSPVQTKVGGCIPCGDSPDIEGFVLSKKNTSIEANLKLGKTGLFGTYTDGRVTLTVTGARSVFKSRDAESKALAAKCPTGIWGLYVKSSGTNNFERGYGALALELKKGGKAKVSGYLGDGTRVSVSTQAIMGDNGMTCVPVIADLYGKKGGLAFVVWFKDGKLLSVDDTTVWKAAGKYAFECPVTVNSTMSPGMGNVPNELELTIAGLSEDSLISGLPLIQDQSLDEVVVKRNSWKSLEGSFFKATCNAKTGLLTGTVSFQVTKNGKPKKVSGKFYGVVVGGSAYGTVVVKNDGCWAVRVAVCGSCND